MVASIKIQIISFFNSDHKKMNLFSSKPFSDNKIVVKSTSYMKEVKNIMEYQLI